MTGSIHFGCFSRQIRFRPGFNMFPSLMNHQSWPEENHSAASVLAAVITVEGSKVTVTLNVEPASPDASPKNRPIH
jgi:hypothetical protein